MIRKLKKTLVAIIASLSIASPTKAQEQQVQESYDVVKEDLARYLPIISQPLFLLSEHPERTSDVTAYYFFQRHRNSFTGDIPLDALACQMGIYKELVRLYKERLISQVYVEGVDKGKDVIDYDSDPSFLQKFRGTKRRLDDKSLYDLLSPSYDILRRNSGNVLELSGGDTLFAVVYDGFIPVVGWENPNRLTWMESLNIILSNYKFSEKAQEFLNKRRSGEITVDSSEYQAFHEEMKKVKKENMELMESRSADAYYNPLELNKAWREMHPKKTLNYAVVIGVNHFDDIYNIVEKELEVKNSVPNIITYSCF